MAYQKKSSSLLIVLITIAFFAGVSYFLFGKSSSESQAPKVTGNTEATSEPVQLASPTEESSKSPEVNARPPSTEVTATSAVEKTVVPARRTTKSPAYRSRATALPPDPAGGYVEKPANEEPEQRSPTQDELAPTPQYTEVAESPYASQSSVLVWFGLGASYLTFDQSAMGGDDQGKFSQLTAPVYAAGARVALNEEHRVAVEFNSWSGQATTEAATQVGSDKFKWRNFAIDYHYNFWKNESSRLFVLAGFNIYQLPFIVFNNDDTQTLARSDLKNVSLGILWERPSSNEITYEASLKYNYLIGSGSSGSHAFDADPGIQIQSTVGVSKNLSENIKLGLFWQGHYQDLDYTSTSANSTGTLNLFTNSAQIRLGYWF